MADHFTSTTARDGTCPRCRAALLTALDEGLAVHADATPLPDRQAEIDALLDGLWTYVFTANRHLVHRDAGRIAANMLRGSIHAEHKCVGPAQLMIDDLIGAQ